MKTAKFGPAQSSTKKKRIVKEREESSPKPASECLNKYRDMLNTVGTFGPVNAKLFSDFIALSPSLLHPLAILVLNGVDS